MSKAVNAEPTKPRRPDVENYLPFVEAIAYRMARKLPRHLDPRDLIQQGFIGLLDAADRFHPGHGVKFQTFAYRRVSGAIYDALRRQNGTRKQPPELYSPSSVNLETPEALFQRNEGAEWVRRAVDQLPDRERLVIQRYYFDEATMKAIGFELGIGESRVFQLHARAIRRLRG